MTSAYREITRLQAQCDRPARSAHFVSGLIRSGFIVALGLLLGRVSGFLREVLIASTFGSSADADLAVLLLTIPDLMINVLVGGAFSAALIPELRRLDSRTAARLFVQGSLVAGVLFSVLAGILSLVPGAVVLAFAPGLDPALIDEASALVAVSIWLVPLTSLAGVSLAYLHSQDRFGIASLGTFFYNITVVAGLLLVAWGAGGLRLLCAFVLLGGLVRWLSQLLVLPRAGMAHGDWLVGRPLLLRYVQASLAGGAALLMPVVARAFASFDGQGAIALFNYALKLTEFALGLTATVLTIVMFPRFAERFAGQDEAAFSGLLRDGIWWTLVLGLCTALPLMWFAPHFVGIVYGWGRMTSGALTEVASLAQLGMLSLPLQAISNMLSAAFNARRDMMTPLIASMAGLAACGAIAYMSQDHFGLRGTMTGLVAGYALTLALKAALLQFRHGISLRETLFTPATARAFALAVSLCSMLGWIGSSSFESPAAGVVVAGFSALLGAAACVGVTRRYRDAVLARLR